MVTTKRGCPGVHKKAINWTFTWQSNMDANSVHWNQVVTLLDLQNVHMERSAMCGATVWCLLYPYPRNHSRKRQALYIVARWSMKVFWETCALPGGSGSFPWWTSIIGEGTAVSLTPPYSVLLLCCFLNILPCLTLTELILPLPISK